jgi:hypothetical protein
VLVTRRHRERGRHGRTAMARLRDDAGAVAILVALSVSTFLLGFAALAVDFGQVYTRQGELQSVADAAALAGATELPDVPEARLRAVQTLCSQANRISGWPDGACPVSAADPVPPWAVNGNDSDGEIIFYAEPDNLGEFTTPIGGDGDAATGIQVKLPPSTVRFGLAGTLGADDFAVSKAATARVGTPLGAGVLPFAVTVEDLSNRARNREFCVTDPDVGGLGTGTYPGPTGTFPTLITVNPFFVNRPTTGQTLTVQPFGFFGQRLPDTRPMAVVIDGHRIVAPDADVDPDRVSVRLDVDLSPGFHQVWLEAGTPRSFVSAQATLFVSLAGPGPAPPPGGDGACGRPDARGVLDIGREVEPPGAPDQAKLNAVLSDNIKSGIDPTPHRFNEHPDPLPLGLGDVVGARCRGPLAGILGGLLNALLSLVGIGYADDINCVTTRDRGFSDGLTQGLLDPDDDSPGLLLRRCSDADTVTTHNVTIDGTDLQEVSDRDLTPGGQDILDVVRSGSVARGAITADAFACPRLGVVPVINPGVNPLHFIDGEYPIVDLVYVWIQDDDDGLVFEDGGNRLEAVKFYVIDPQFFGRTVSGSTKVGPFLGDNFPREVMLVKNPGDP